MGIQTSPFFLFFFKNIRDNKNVRTQLKSNLYYRSRPGLVPRLPASLKAHYVCLPACFYCFIASEKGKRKVFLCACALYVFIVSYVFEKKKEKRGCLSSHVCTVCLSCMFIVSGKNICLVSLHVHCCVKSFECLCSRPIDARTLNNNDLFGWNCNGNWI